MLWLVFILLVITETHVIKELVDAHRAYIELWMHAGSLESTKEASELLEGIAESNSSFLSALQSFKVHP